jgi:hypothetical protein
MAFITGSSIFSSVNVPLHLERLPPARDSDLSPKSQVIVDMLKYSLIHGRIFDAAISYELFLLSSLWAMRVFEPIAIITKLVRVDTTNEARFRPQFQQLLGRIDTLPQILAPHTANFGHSFVRFRG